MGSVRASDESYLSATVAGARVRIDTMAAFLNWRIPLAVETV